MTGLSNTGSTQLPPITLDPVGQEGLVSKNVVNPEVANGLQNIVQQTAKQEVAKQASKKTILSGMGQKKQAEAAQNIAVDIENNDKEPGYFHGLMSGLGNIAGQAGDFLGTEQGRLLLSGVAGHAVGREFGVPGVAGGVQGLKGGMKQLNLERKQTAVLAEKTAVKKLDALKIDKDNKKDIAKGEDTLRKEFNPFIKKFNDVKTANNKAAKAFSLKTAAGDHAGIFSYMKTVDPGSTVREGEFATVQNARGWGEIARTAYNKALAGEMLSPSQRADFTSTAQKLFEEEKAVFDGEKRRYTDIAKDRNLNKDNIFGKARKMDKIIKTNKPTVAKDSNKQALEWAQANPNDPRAKQILQKLGV